MPTDNGRMTAAEFCAALDMLGETAESFAGLLVALGDVANDKQRTVQRWRAGTQDVPGPIHALLQVLILALDEGVMTLALLREWLADAETDETLSEPKKLVD